MSFLLALLSMVSSKAGAGVLTRSETVLQQLFLLLQPAPQEIEVRAQKPEAEIPEGEAGPQPDESGGAAPRSTVPESDGPSGEQSAKAPSDPSAPTPSPFPDLPSGEITAPTRRPLPDLPTADLPMPDLPEEDSAEADPEIETPSTDVPQKGSDPVPGLPSGDLSQQDPDLAPDTPSDDHAQHDPDPAPDTPSDDVTPPTPSPMPDLPSGDLPTPDTPSDDHAQHDPDPAPDMPSDDHAQQDPDPTPDTPSDDHAQHDPDPAPDTPSDDHAQHDPDPAPEQPSDDHAQHDPDPAPDTPSDDHAQQDPDPAPDTPSDDHAQHDPDPTPDVPDAGDTTGSPVVLIFGQSNGGALATSDSMMKAAAKLGVTVTELNLNKGASLAATADAPWNIQVGDGHDAPGEMYTRLITEVAAYLDANPDAYIANAVWVHGESDTGFPATWDNYYDAVAELFTQARAEIGVDFPISVVGLSDQQSTFSAGREVVRDAQQKLAADLSDVYYVDTDAIVAENNLVKEDVLVDNLHYTADFLDRIAEAVLEEPAIKASLGLAQSGGETPSDQAGHDHGDGGSTPTPDPAPDAPSDDHAHHDHGDTPAPEPDMTPEEIEAFVAAVKATTEGHAHGDHAGKMSEHMAAMDLVAHADATHIAIKSGDWDDPSNWYQGRIPDDDARALIPEGIEMTYGTVSDARLFTLRVDGQLDFATDTDSRLVVDTFVVSPAGKLTIGTEADPVAADVDVEIVFANNGAIDTAWDPMLLSRGMIAHGEVEIHGAEKDSHEKVSEDPMAGDTSILFDTAPTGWEIGDTIVIAGTRYEGYYNWEPSVGYSPSEDEERVITAIQGNQVYFDEPLVHDHDSPRADLKTSVANYTRNVSFETENAINAEVHERGHVMFMHNDDVDVRYAEFHELGRTDKSEDAMDVGAFDTIAADSNVKGRYAFHFHRAGTDDQGNPAIAEGNAVYGSPGWGFVHHDSHAILENNASYNTFGAGYVAESGNETGAWHDNIAILAQGVSWQDPKGINASVSRIDLFDMGRSGDGFWFQGRMVESTDNVAASVHNGFVYFHRGSVADDANIPFDADVSIFPELFGYDDTVVPGDHPILNFSGNETFAAKAGVYVLKAWFTQGHDVYTVMEDFTAWSVRDGADLSYTGHYILKDFDVVARETTALSGPWGTGIKLGNNIVDLTIVDANIEGFQTGINLNKALVGGLSPELHSYTIINPTFTGVETEYKNYDPALDTIIDHAQLANLTPDIALDGPLYYNHGHPAETPGGRVVEITGTKTDSLGSVDFPTSPENFDLSAGTVRDMLQEKGYYTTSDGQDYFVVDLFFSDRASGDIYVEHHAVFVDENAKLDDPNHLYFSDVAFNGVQDFGVAGDPTSDVARLWATITDGQPVLSEQMPSGMDDAMLMPSDEMLHDHGLL